MVAPGFNRMIVAATPEAFQQGDRMTVLPPHIRVMDWFNFSALQKNRLEQAVTTIFGVDDVLQDVKLGRRSWKYRSEMARQVKNIDRGRWFAIHALVRSMGDLQPEDERFADVLPRFVPMGRDLPTRGPLHLSTVALFSVRNDDELPVYIEAAVQIGPKRDQETA